MTINANVLDVMQVFELISVFIQHMGRICVNRIDSILQGSVKFEQMLRVLLKRSCLVGSVDNWLLMLVCMISFIFFKKLLTRFQGGQVSSF